MKTTHAVLSRRTDEKKFKKKKRYFFVLFNAYSSLRNRASTSTGPPRCALRESSFRLVFFYYEARELKKLLVDFERNVNNAYGFSRNTFSISLQLDLLDTFSPVSSTVRAILPSRAPLKSTTTSRVRRARAKNYGPDRVGRCAFFNKNRFVRRNRPTVPPRNNNTEFLPGIGLPVVVTFRTAVVTGSGRTA